MDATLNTDAGARLVEEFADFAGEQGWTKATLARFCARRGIAPSEQARRWPDDVRSLAREWNTLADRRTRAQAERLGPRPLSVVIAERFLEHEGDKRSVGKLARSDLFHPIDTIARTRTTAELMWQCQDQPLLQGPDRPLRVWWLVSLYSACVLVWLATRPPYRGLHRAIAMAARIAGGR